VTSVEFTVGPTHAAGGDGDADVIPWRRGGFDVGESQVSASLCDVHCFVCGHGSTLILQTLGSRWDSAVAVVLKPS
jgi:hypothetical protein